MQTTTKGSGWSRGRRRQYVINPAFQWKYTLLFMLTAFVISSLLSVTLFGVHFQQARTRAITLLENPGAPLPNDIVVLLVFSALAFSTVAATLIGLWTIFFTHRVSGPIFVMGQWLEELRDGRFPAIRPLRKRDEFKDFHATLAQVVESLKEGKRKDLARVSEAMALIRSAQTARPQERERSLQALAACLRAMQEDAARMLGQQIADESPEPTTRDAPASACDAELAGVSA